MEGFEQLIESMASNSLFQAESKEDMIQLERFIASRNSKQEATATRMCIAGVPVDASKMRQILQAVMYGAFIIGFRFIFRDN